MPVHGDFDLRAVYDALDARRRERQISWTVVASEVNRFRTRLRPIAVSTITSLRTKPKGEGDGILQMLLWLGRTPESFVPGVADAGAERFRLPDLKRGEILRWDTRALFRALDAERQERQLTWAQVAREVRFTSGMLTTLAKGPKIGLPRVMRLVRWLDRPAVTSRQSRSGDLVPQPERVPEQAADDGSEDHERAHGGDEVRIDHQGQSRHQLRPPLLLLAVDEQDEPDAGRNQRQHQPRRIQVHRRILSWMAAGDLKRTAGLRGHGHDVATW